MVYIFVGTRISNIFGEGTSENYQLQKTRIHLHLANSMSSITINLSEAASFIVFYLPYNIALNFKANSNQ